jgi:hypothetical protein
VVLFRSLTVTTIVVVPTGPALVTNPLLSTLATEGCVDVHLPWELGIAVDAVRPLYHP